MIKKVTFILFLVINIYSYELISEEKTQVSLAVKGGVSLGSYESGVNWVLINELKRRKDKFELNTISGASAGAINAVVSAINYCQKDNKKLNVSDNIYRKIWNVGIEKLVEIKVTEENGLESLSVEEQEVLDDEYSFDDYYESNIKNSNTEINQNNKLNYNDFISDLQKIMDDEEWYINNIKNNDEVGKEKRDKGGLFSRHALLPSLSAVYNEVYKKNNFRNGCQVKISLAVTKLIPDVTNKHGIDVKNQRYVIPLLVSVKNNKLYFSNFESKNTLYNDCINDKTIKNKKQCKKITDLDDYIYLPQRLDGSIRLVEVLKAAMASSAFPVAFAPINLSYCKKIEEIREEYSTDNCPDNFYQKNDLFSDGGSFDNAPIGTTIKLSQYKNKLKMKDKDKHIYGYLNPGMYRGNNGNDLKDSFGYIGDAKKYVTSTLDYIRLGSYVMDHGMNVELENSLVKDSLHIDKNYITTRYYPLVGDYLEHFAAFFDEKFRDFDFNVGVYDGVINVSTFMCNRKYRKLINESKDKAVELKVIINQCIGEESKIIYENLNLAEHSDDSQVFSLLVDKEFGTVLDDESWGWLNLENRESKSAYKNIFESLDSKQCLFGDNCSSKVYRSDFKTFLSSLDEKYFYSEPVKTMIKNPDEWQYSMIGPAIERLIDIENNKLEYMANSSNTEEYQKQEFVTRLVETAGFMSRTYIGKKESGFWPVSTNPDASWFIPDEVGGDILNSGFYFAYNFPWQAFDNKNMVIETTLIPYRFIRDEIYGADSASIDMTVRYHFDNPKVSSFGLGAMVYRDWEEFHPDLDQVGYGGAVDMGFFGDKLRLTLLHRNYPKIHEQEYMLLVGVTDFKGIFKWMFY